MPRQDAQRNRQDRILELDEQVRQIQSVPPTQQQQEMLRQLNNQKRDIQNAILRGSSITIDSTVPPWVSLLLGSAYFRANRMADAEREYKAAIDADPKFGEAHSNLAVVYLESGRIRGRRCVYPSGEEGGLLSEPRPRASHSGE